VTISPFLHYITSVIHWSMRKIAKEIKRSLRTVSLSISSSFPSESTATSSHPLPPSTSTFPASIFPSSSSVVIRACSYSQTPHHPPLSCLMIPCIVRLLCWLHVPYTDISQPFWLIHSTVLRVISHMQQCLMSPFLQWSLSAMITWCYLIYTASLSLPVLHKKVRAGVYIVSLSYHYIKIIKKSNKKKPQVAQKAVALKLNLHYCYYVYSM